MGTVHPIAANENSSLEYNYYRTTEGEIPFWDHPHVKGTKIVPPVYRPITTLYGIMSQLERRRLTEEDMTLIKVLGDAICCTEEQLKRYMKSKMTASQVSKRLKRFRELAIVDRWQMRVIGEEEIARSSSPYTLGIGGYKILKHFYNGNFFMDPERWDKYGFKGFQRYISANEIRCRLFESHVLRAWKWSPYINKKPHLSRPLSGATVETSKGPLNLIIERAQMSQDFISFLGEKLHLWKHVVEQNRSLSFTGFDDNPFVVVISAATRSMAEHIHKELMLDVFPFQIWLCVEEDLNREGLGSSFYRAKEKELARMNLGFITT